MTPKEKAAELIAKFKKCTSYKYQEYAGANYSVFEHDTETIKECALIAVNEILDLGYSDKEKSSCNLYQFYSSVKIEITSM